MKINQNFLLAICMICMLGSCRYNRPLVMESNDCSRIAKLKVESVLLTNGDEVTFDKNGGKFFESRTNDSTYQAIVGNSQENIEVKIPIATVVKVRGVQSESENVATVLLSVIGGTAIAVSLVVIILLGN